MSRRQSPRRLKTTTVMRMAKMGINTICGIVVMKILFSASILPHSGAGGLPTKPKKESAERVIIISLISDVVAIAMLGNIFGII